MSYLDKRGNIYVRMAEGGIRKIEDPGVESIHLEDSLLSGLEIAAAKGALLAGGKFVEKMSPEIAVFGAKLLTDTKGLGEIAFGKLSSGLGLWAKVNKTSGDKELIPITTIQRHPLEGWTPKQVIEHADRLGLKTPPNQLILWSGLGRGDAGIELSQAYAAANGGVTLEMANGGKWLDQLDLFGINSPYSQQDVRQIWRDVSTRMIQQASGQVRSLVGIVNPSSIYRAEQSELLLNEKILGLDELNLKPRYGIGNY